MHSKPGSILLLISAIINFILALGVLILTVYLATSDVSLGEENGTIVGTILLIVIFIVLIVFGILKLWAHNLMKDPSTTYKGGIVALIVGFLNGGDLLAIIGGILGITAGNNKE